MIPSDSTSLFPRVVLSLRESKDQLLAYSRDFDRFGRSFLDMDVQSRNYFEKSVVDTVAIVSMLSNEFLQQDEVSQINSHEKKSLSDKRTSVLQLVDKLIKTFAVPRYFFNTSRNVTVKLELEMEKRHYNSRDVITSFCGAGIVVTPSGYVSFRQGHEKHLKSAIVSISTSKHNEKTNLDIPQRLTIPIKENAFSTQTMCFFTDPGFYIINVSLGFIDVNNQEFYSDVHEEIRVSITIEEPITRSFF